MNKIHWPVLAKHMPVTVIQQEVKRVPVQGNQSRKKSAWCLQPSGFEAGSHAWILAVLRDCLVHAAVNAEEGVGVSAALDLFNSLTGECPLLHHN